MTPWIDYWIFLGLALCCLYVPYFLIRGEGARLLAGCVCCMAVIQAYILLGAVAGPTGWLSYLHQWVLYPVAPLLYLYFVFLLGEPCPAIRVVRHLAPTLLVAAVTGLEWLIPEWKLPGLQAVYVFAFISGAAYSVAILRRLGALVQPAGLMRVEALLLMTVGVLGVVIAGLVVAGGLLSRNEFYTAYGCAISLLMVLGHFLILLYPHIPETLADELQDAVIAADAPVRRSQLSGVDIPKALMQLQQRLEQEQVYRRYDLTLPLMAGMIGLTPHQLSELINMHLGMNFTRLVKMHRVREAKDLLLDRPSTSALDIGLSVGFTSLSAFYAAFRELEGMAPGQFRKQARPSATD